MVDSRDGLQWLCRTGRLGRPGRGDVIVSGTGRLERGNVRTVCGGKDSGQRGNGRR